MIQPLWENINLNSILNYLPERNENIHSKTCPRVFIAVSFMIPLPGDNPNIHKHENKQIMVCSNNK